LQPSATFLLSFSIELADLDRQSIIPIPVRSQG